MSQRTPPLMVAATILCAGCTSSATKPSATTSPSTAALESSRADSTAPGFTLPIGAEPVNLNPADLTADITNPNWPMRPGTRWTYRDTDEKGEVQDYKLYAPDIGPVLAVGISGGAAREALVKLDKAAPKDGTARSASPIRNRHRSHDYGSLSIIVKSLLLCES
jgi:hypothetical protein